MSNQEAFQCRLLFAALLIFHQSAGAGVIQDRDRVLITYNPATDYCYTLTTNSTPEARDAADLACMWAFEALDRLEGNSCDEWRRPKCRLINGVDHFQCSCEVANMFKVTAHEAISFRDCAWRLCAEEILIKPMPAPSAHFKKIYEQIYADAFLKASLRKASRRPAHAEASTSRPPKIPRTASVSNVGQSFRVGSSSHKEGAPNTPNTSKNKRKRGPAVDPATASGAPRPQHKCEICNHVYASLHILKDHQLSHKYDIRCPECINQTFSTRGNLNLHLRRFHPKLIKPDSVDRPYKCEDCGKAYVRESSLASHKVVHTEDVQCKVCNMDFSTKSNYKYHMEQQHPEEVEAQKVEEEILRLLTKGHVCETCQARFTCKRALQEHKAVHRGETYCDECQRIFPRKAALTIHKKIKHSKPKTN